MRVTNRHHKTVRYTMRDGRQVEKSALRHTQKFVAMRLAAAKRQRMNKIARKSRKVNRGKA